MRANQPANAAAETTTERRRRLLLVEADALTRWSIQTYLGKWFAVDVAERGDVAVLIAAAPPDAMLLSDDVSAEEAAALHATALARKAGVMTLRLITGATDAVRQDGAVRELEKPFALAQLARLLGIPEQEIPSA